MPNTEQENKIIILYGIQTDYLSFPKHVNMWPPKLLGLLLALEESHISQREKDASHYRIPENAL